MRMTCEYETGDHYIVYPRRLFIELTHAGYLEIMPEHAKQEILERLPERAIKLLRTEMPVVIITPTDLDKRKLLPEFLWIAEFDQTGGPTRADGFVRARLCVCWFSDDLNESPDGAFRSVLAKVNWKPAACEYSWDP